ncbi:hypothetical protein SLEP1_g491 [Rubroshorea leprosula]|uniref:Glycosyltransferase n=2 Tax=Rubroshorea leprosula TaxID=152421 RepID=A0AAV5HLK7_9ROSI|nr:hypothetical protein SLEP1_g491 [Rubroshorea leprosula]
MPPMKDLQGPHVAVLVFPFGSHGLTILNLTLRLASAASSVHFSFLSTANSNASLLRTAELPSNIRAYDVDDGLPVNHATRGHSPEVVELFLEAAPVNLKRALDTAISETGRRINFLLTDLFLTLFAEEMAAELRVPWIPLCVAVPYDLSAHVYTDQIREQFRNSDCSNGSILEHRKLEFIPGLSPFSAIDLPEGILPTDSEESLLASMLSKVGKILPKAAAIVMNFFQELYSVPLRSDLYSLFPNLLNLGFLTVQLPPPPLPPSSSDETGCLSWLDSKNPKSVVYISFGTVAKLPSAELIALAEALEETETSFLWVLDENSQQFLPIGFLENVRSSGKIVSWAPQRQVLRHPSTAVFITHAGANSVFESIAYEVPMIYRPFFGDHRINGRLVEEVWGIGVGVEGLVLTKSGVAKSLNLFLGDEEGKKMRQRIQLLNRIVLEAAGPNGSATQDFKALVELIILKLPKL